MVPTGTLASVLVMLYLQVLLYLMKLCSTYGYSFIRLSPVVPTVLLYPISPVSDKFCLYISPVVPTGIPVSDKSCI